MRKRRQRGSTLLYVTVMVIAITSIVVASAELTFGAVRAQKELENRMRVWHAVEGAVSHATTLYRFDQLPLPTTYNYTINGVDCLIECTDAGAPARTFRVTVSLELDGSPYSEVRYTGKRIVPSAWYYAIYATNLSISGALVTGSLGNNGDVYFAANAVGPINHTVNGDLECAGSVNTNRWTATGTTWPGANTFARPPINALNYLAAPNLTLELTGIIDGYTFTDLLGNHQILYRTGNLSMRGTFDGRGVIFVDGSVTVSNNITLTAGSKLVVIATGPIRISSSASSIQGFYYTNGEFRVDASMFPRTLNSGGIVCDTLRLDSAYNVIHDPLFWDDPTQLAKLRMPGHWP